MRGNALLVDLYELTMAECYFRLKKETQATFDLFVRQLPAGRSFLVFAGLADALEHAASLRFSSSDLEYLAGLKLFSAAFLKYLRGFRFRGDIWAMPEGSVFFPNEPVIRVTAGVIEAQILESFFLSTINLQTMIASKAARCVLAASGKGVIDFSLRRTHGAEAGLKASRSAYIAGFSATSNVLAGKLYGIPVAGTMAHSFVMAFENERESFDSYAAVFPRSTVLLVDTYNWKQGVRNAVETGKAMRRRGERLSGIRIDSGNLAFLSRTAREALDRAGLKDTKIFASGDLDEYRIAGLLKAGAPIDSFGVGTRMGASVDAPALEVIYKLSEIKHGPGMFLPTMKLSSHKVTFPGRKQVYRTKDSSGRFRYDTIGLEGERPGGLLIPAMLGGRNLYLDPVRKARERFLAELASLPSAIRDLDRGRTYPVRVSPSLKDLTAEVRDRFSQRQ